MRFAIFFRTAFPQSTCERHQDAHLKTHLKSEQRSSIDTIKHCQIYQMILEGQFKNRQSSFLNALKIYDFRNYLIPHKRESHCSSFIYLSPFILLISIYSVNLSGKGNSYYLESFYKKTLLTTKKTNFKENKSCVATIIHKIFDINSSFHAK